MVQHGTTWYLDGCITSMKRTMRHFCCVHELQRAIVMMHRIFSWVYNYWLVGRTMILLEVGHLQIILKQSGMFPSVTSPYYVWVCLQIGYTKIWCAILCNPLIFPSKVGFFHRRPSPRWKRRWRRKALEPGAAVSRNDGEMGQSLRPRRDQRF